jgi:hypothetical protein
MYICICLYIYYKDTDKFKAMLFYMEALDVKLE